MEGLREVAGHLTRREASAFVVDRHGSTIEVNSDGKLKLLGRETLARPFLASDRRADDWSPGLEIERQLNVGRRKTEPEHVEAVLGRSECDKSVRTDTILAERGVNAFHITFALVR